MPALTRKSGKTLVKQLKDALMEEIRAGRLRSGEKIPSERDLTRIYGVSRATVRNTVLALAAERIVTRAVGSGTYVNEGIDLETGGFSGIGTIGLLVGRQHVPIRNIHDDFYYYRVMEGIQQELHSSNGHMLFAYIDEDEAANAMTLTGLAGKVDGLLLAETASRGLLDKAAELDVPCVLINSSIDEVDLPFDSLGVNNRAGARKAVSYLIGLGHERIGCIRGPVSSRAANDRYEGYLHALEEAGIPRDAVEVEQARGWTTEDGIVAVAQILSRAPHLSALFCASDTLALGAIEAAAGRRNVPAELSVVGFDDISLSAHTHPPLTTVRSPTFELGQLSGRQLLKRIANRKLSITSVLLSPQLVVRESCAGPATKVLGTSR